MTAADTIRSLIPPELSLNQNLYVDNGRFWVDFGLTLPRWPQIVLGYEYDFKKGTKSMLDWGNVGGTRRQHCSRDQGH